MTKTVTASADQPFARLADELAELGFEAERYSTPGPRQYRAPDSPLRVTIDDSLRPPRATFSPGDDEGPDWQIDLRGDVPDPAQVMALYTALHPDDTAEAARAATATT
jgi:hypothetical protein